jgi:hypothetical protein
MNGFLALFAPGLVEMRREFIYLHRSVRSFPISRKRMFIAFTIASLMCLAVCVFGSFLLYAHSQVSGFILTISGIQTAGIEKIGIFQFWNPVNAASIASPGFEGSFQQIGLLFLSAFAGLILIYRLIPLGRTFVTCLIIILCATTVKVLTDSNFRMSSAMFEQIWLRGEFLVWILLPWVSSLFFVLTIPSLRQGLTWLICLQIYAVIWSAVRLAFCQGIFYYSGALFLPTLWFCLGILFDLVYLLVFYSFALHRNMQQVLGERRP